MMEDDGSSKDAMSQKKTSIDDIIDHITADLQSYDGKYILLGQPSDSETQSIWQQRVTRQPENLNYVQNSFQEQPRINHRPLDQNFYFSSNSFIDNARSNYVPCMYNSNQYQNANTGDSHYNYVYYQSNPSPPNSDYGLFNPSNFQNHHLIENLVGNWVPNQSGTYSQFGSPSHMIENRMETSMSMQHQSPPSQHSNSSNTFSKLGNNVVRRPRMVAEVRPMRPSYSDVLAKSVTQPVGSSTNNPTKQVTASKVDIVRPKAAKNKKGTGNNATKNGGALLKRQHSSGSEEQMLNGIRQANDKKTSPTNENHSWSSAEDIPKLSGYADSEKDSPTDRSPLSNLNNKKGSGRKAKGARQNETGSENKKLNANQTEARKVTKKITLNNSNNNLQWGVGKQTSPVRNEKKVVKSNLGVEVKKSSANKNSGSNAENTVDNSKSNVNSKISARFSSVSASQRKVPRCTKRREGASKIALVWKRWREKTSQYVMLFFTWFVYLLWDVLIMSFHLCLYLLGVIANCSGTWFSTVKALLKNVCMNPRNWWHQRKKGSKTSSSKKFPHSNRSDNSTTNLTSNISLPQTGEEAMKRLFACKGKDPYSILGVTKNCPDEVIKKYYKRQAVLVHPDKNNQPGAEEAFKILVHAFDLIGEPERRKAYDRCMMDSIEVEWEKLSDLLSQLHKKMEYAANTIRCTNCGQRHKRSMVDRPLYAARFCSQCKIHHSAREGDIWAESSMLGWLWRYYACMDGAVYDISDWAACQADNLRHLKPNTHVVQYRIVVGKHRPNPPPASPQPPPPSSPNCSEQDLEDFLSSLYGHGSGGQGTNGDHNRFRKKSKRKK